MTGVFNEAGDPIETFDEDGNPIEVLPKSEAEEKIEEAKLEAKEKAADLTDKIAELTVKVNAKTEEMKGEDDKTKNFKELRKSRDELQKELGDTKTELATYKDTTTKEIESIKQTFTGKQLDDAIKEVAGNDPEVQKKVKFHFNNFKPDTETDPVKREENFKERIKSAHILAGGVKGNILGNTAATTGGYVPAPPGEATQTTPEGEVKDMGIKKMGLSDKDFRDHKKGIL